MANLEHVEWILEGADSWNERRASSKFIPDLSGFDFFGEFSEKDLLDERGMVPLVDYDLTDADLRGCNLINADIDGLSLRGADLSGSNIATSISLSVGGEADLERLFSIEFGGLIRWYRIHRRMSFEALEKKATGRIAGQRLLALEGGSAHKVEDLEAEWLCNILGIDGAEVARVRRRVLDRFTLVARSSGEIVSSGEEQPLNDGLAKDRNLIREQALNLLDHAATSRLSSIGTAEILRMATTQFRLEHNNLPEDLFIVEAVERILRRIHISFQFERLETEKILMLEIENLRAKIEDLNSQIKQSESGGGKALSESAWQKGKVTFAQAIGSGTAAALVGGSAYLLGAYGQDVVNQLGGLLDAVAPRWNSGTPILKPRDLLDGTI